VSTKIIHDAVAMLRGFGFDHIEVVEGGACPTIIATHPATGSTLKAQLPRRSRSTWAAKFRSLIRKAANDNNPVGKAKLGALLSEPSGATTVAEHRASAALMDAKAASARADTRVADAIVQREISRRRAAALLTMEKKS
jgi:hypothetical protein